MSETKHTPGQWDLMTPVGAVRSHSHPTRFWVSYVSSDDGVVAAAHGRTAEEAEANARVISAALDLLAVARKAILAETWRDAKKSGLFDEARAAIAKYEVPA